MKIHHNYALNPATTTLPVCLIGCGKLFRVLLGHASLRTVSVRKGRQA